MNVSTIRSFADTESDLDAVSYVLTESQRVLDPDFLAAGVGFEREYWAEKVHDPQTEWVLALATDGTPAGFAGWRYLPAMSHLHALFVVHAHQRQGYGRALLAHHWRTVLQRQPDTTLFTLHVREPAFWAWTLYERQGYRFYQAGDEAAWPALVTWLAACRVRDNWPLPAGKRLMFRPARD